MASITGLRAQLLPCSTRRHAFGSSAAFRPAAARGASAARGAARPDRDCAIAPLATGSERQEVQPLGADRRQMLQMLLASAALLQQAPAALAAAAGQEVVPEGNAFLLNSEQAASLTAADKQVLTLNRRIQKQNQAPLDFPAFVREGFDIKIIADGFVLDDSGIIYKDFEVGRGPTPVDGQEVVFDYTGFNESGAAIDTSYRQGRPAQTRLGIQGLIPGFELGIRGMRAGGKRRIIVPPKLGPPVGPSTFFSAKQCEVFDVELREIRTCSRRQVMMFSDVVCE